MRRLNIQSSYIFLPNPYKKKEPFSHNENNVIVINIGKNVYSFLEKNFPSLSRVEADDDTPFRRQYHCSTSDTDSDNEIHLIINEVADVTYLDVIVEGNSKRQMINCLETFQGIFLTSGIQEEYIDIISYDAISEFYCNKILPKLNELERNLRKLLLNIYIVHFGKDYYSTTVSPDLQNKIKSTIKAKGSREKKEIELLRQFFYSFELSDVQQLLFSPRWTIVENQAREEFLSKNADLSKLSDQQLREAFYQFSPKSDWDRFFSSKIDISDIEKTIDQIRTYRNKAAHFKSFYKNDYNECILLIRKLNRAIVNAIGITEEIDFSEKNMELLQQSIAGVSQLLEKFKEKVTTITQNITQQQMQLEAVLSPILGRSKKIIAEAIQDLSQE